MTSLIDVIFLLLLFFMLSSTFTRFSEVELAAAGAGGADRPEAPVFLSLTPDSLQLNGNTAHLATLPDALVQYRADDAPLTVLIALKGAVTAQRLTDALAALRGIKGLHVTVLEST
ncbi:biopolymer transporter ExbD [Roseovarius sp. A21]|uniref:Biopolymer transporter ExbD n=1 Tax=Roseovarius bejariae TaxID=2576383 RepID=A0A844CWY3_9RHOB|nr:biopolymer transporter ExbD [Roseovarius bejariae]